MTTKECYVSVFLLLVVILLSGCTSPTDGPSESRKICIPTYTLDSAHEISKDDLETINKFYDKGEVFWVQKPAKNYTDAPYEMVLYLTQEGKSLVVKDRGLGSISYHLFEGVPCK